MKRFYNLVVSVIVLYFLAACSAKTAESSHVTDTQTAEEVSESLDDAETAQDVIDVPIYLKAYSTKNDEYGDYPDLYFVGEQSDESLSINPEGKYYRIIQGNGDAHTVGYLDDYDCCNELPVISCNIINNTDQDLDITGLDVHVKYSAPDQTPIIYITSEGIESYTLTFVNDSWFDWKECVFEYSILKRGEDFNGKYNYSKNIKYFQDSQQINFKKDIIDSGLNLESVEQHGGFAKICHLVGLATDNWDKPLPDDIRRVPGLENLDYPFEFERSYDPMARIVGRLTFSDGHVQPFKGYISLWADGFGGWYPTEEQYNFKFKEAGRDYTVSYPYVSVILQGKAEKISIALNADKSSRHEFEIVAKNTNGLIIKSCPVSLYLLKPRHGSKTVVAGKSEEN